MKLYFSPMTRATRPRWMLEELGVPYELATLDMMKGEHKKPEYLKIHPLGAVPALEDGGFTMYESAAIIMYLADKYPEKGLAPALGTADRGAYYQWISFAMTEADPLLVTILMNTRFLPEAERSAAAVEKASQRFKVIAPIIQERMKGREYIVGNKFSAADVVVGGTLALANMLNALDGYPDLKAYLGRLMERPATKKAFA
ncbi:glutathione S-transferase family protein [Hyalangium sp.]|uniref:glutathione S-transferase family protein n=1 Tax=Hyalangium sp. TaxID=2028555 RepID=UPI002D6DB462|nr:glutathione S-transferase family protein [Hyalangium sp.]HYH97735.1 glutathione S-transferase family protein [Hyalangium sp.]